jgi:hypothetical protein
MARPLACSLARHGLASGIAADRQLRSALIPYSEEAMKADERVGVKLGALLRAIDNV